ncbi:MAG: type II secretion system protein [Nitrospirae bacterium]|nr:type II secretion system protein [Nitrospirota bacterium]
MKDCVKSSILNSEFLIFNSRKGFTLLELTISITMIGFIVLIIAGALSLGFRSVDSGEKRIESLERIRSSVNIINAQIQSQIPLTYNEDGEVKHYFKGGTEFMQFASNYSVWGGEKGYVIVTYTVEPGNNGKQVLSVSENIIGMNEQRNAKLFDNFDRIYFEYFLKDSLYEEGYWVEQFSDEDVIPEKVMLHVTGGTRDFSIIIPVRARGPMALFFSGPEKFTGPVEE